MSPARLILPSALLLLLTACNPAAPADEATSPAPAAAATEAPAAPAPAPAAAEPARFDIATVPLSKASLGDFPYIQLPDGYTSTKVIEKRFERFPFYTGDRVEWVEGQVWSAGIGHQDSALFSPMELQANLDAVMADAGAQRVFRGPVPSAMHDLVKAENRDLAGEYYYGYRAWYSPQYSSWVIQRGESQIWVQAGSDNSSGGLVVVQTRPAVISASLLPATELASALASSGTVNLQINFAVDSARILPDSQPQIAQIAALLGNDPALSLDVRGHTDASGNPAHNRQLSQQRAEAVVAVLVASGIAASRLHASGLGDSMPLADNTSDEGRARNRRVELVRH